MTNKAPHFNLDFMAFYSPETYMGIPLCPSFHAPDKKALQSAIRSFKQNGAITETEATLILQHIVHEGRLTVMGDMVKSYIDTNYSPLKKPEWTAAHVFGTCGVGQLGALKAAEDIGLNAKPFNLTKTTSVKEGQQHMVLHVYLPIKKADNDECEMRRFVVDPTFAQFMRDMREHEYGVLPGEFLCRMGGEKLAFDLCQKSYFEATEDNTHLYIQSFSQRPKNCANPLERIDRAISLGQETIHIRREQIPGLKKLARQSHLRLTA